MLRMQYSDPVNNWNKRCRKEVEVGRKRSHRQLQLRAKTRPQTLQDTASSVMMLPGILHAVRQLIGTRGRYLELLSVSRCVTAPFDR